MPLEGDVVVSSASPPVPVRSDPLAALDRARQALERTTTIPEARTIRDQAEAVRVYARTAGLGLEIQNAAAATRLRAEHKAGTLLAVVVQHGGDRRAGAESHGATLRELGVSKSQSSRWQAVARISEEDLEAYFAVCTERHREITTGALLSLTRPGGRATTPPPWPTGATWRTLLVDPPWPFEKSSTRGAAMRHYAATTLEDLAALPVGELAADDGCHLYLWSTNAHLPNAFELISAWGFTFRTVITWVKPGLGVGSWFRGTTEHILFATRGNLPLSRADLGTHFEGPRGRHSEKPEASYRLIEAASPAPRIELFARNVRPGWTAWGDEIADASGA